MTTPPIACTLTAEELHCAADVLLPGLARMARTVSPHTDGARLTFDASPNTIPHIADVIERERQCCRFLSFSLEIPSDGGAISLDITGPAGTVSFLASLAPEFRATG